MILVAPYGSTMAKVAEDHGLCVAFEAFIDRAYTREGRLVPRTKPSALIEDVDEAVKRALMIIDKGVVLSIDGYEVEVRAHKLCVHGDSPKALDFVRRVYEGLREVGVYIKPLREIIGV